MTAFQNALISLLISISSTQSLFISAKQGIASKLLTYKVSTVKDECIVKLITSVSCPVHVFVYVCTNMLTKQYTYDNKQ